MSELKVYVKPIKTNMFGKMIVGQSYYLKSEADKVIAEKDKEIARLEAIRKVHVEAIASMEAGLHQDEKEICRLKRALYKALANWAHVAVAFFSPYTIKNRWRWMELKCLKKAEEYK